MKNTSSIISTYAADTMGVASALYELGGMVVMHDASGCNSTYSTHDEPRWYNTDSMVYISALTEIDAIMGNDEKLINDIVDTALELKPKFIAVAGTPIPMVIGTDYDALQRIIEKRTKIPTFCIPTNGMNTYILGESAAFYELAKRFVLPPKHQKSSGISVNILGATPLDFYLNGAINELESLLIRNNIAVTSTCAMGNTLKQFANCSNAGVNLVVSSSGAKMAEYLKTEYGIPAVYANPTGTEFTKLVLKDILECAKTGNDAVTYKSCCAESNAKIAVIGEQIAAQSLAAAIKLETGKSAFTVCPTECEQRLNSKNILNVFDESDIKSSISGAAAVVADPLFKPIVSTNTKFIANPHTAFSGRIFNNRSINPIYGFDKIKGELSI